MATARDVVIIGGGHNGLVTAFYLARAGRKPLVLERRPVAGGAAITDEFHPGFKCSTLAHTGGPLRADVARDMQLETRGLQILRPETRVFAPSPEGRALVLYGDVARTAQGIATFSKKDAAKYTEFHQSLRRIASVLGDLESMAPPSVDHPSAGDLWSLLKTGRRFRALGKKDMFRLLRWGPMAVADLVAEWFETELLRGTIAGRGIFGTFLGPWSAGTSAVLLQRAAADGGEAAGDVSFVRGGMGALTQAMAAAARAAGAEIRTGADVARISVKDGAAKGVVLTTGEEIASQAVISNADPRRTLLGLVDPLHLEPDFLIKMQHYRCVGYTAKVNLALSGLPAFTALKGPGGDGAAALSGRIHIGPEIDYLERAYDDAKYGDFSKAPYMDITIPSIADPSLAPQGKHVMSIVAQFAPYKLKKGDWATRREELGDTVVKALAAYAPDLPGRVLQGQVITPKDLEETYGLTGGQIYHGELALDQLFTMRPLLGWARYATPIRSLFLCGSGTHPGVGVTGASGANAAREILKTLR
ncbi:MAG TPA: NAD(P)/FAD-dependent oxidoreductase [Candidatus Polarisedimenticolia bacterium]|nr:NAD(P)/FAD-dependent oxidoreductase [Candidatus Polarisedimenticolia bacterium]